MKSSVAVPLLACATLYFSACSATPGGPTGFDAGFDAGTDDAGTHPGFDAGTDDAGTDAGPCTSTGTKYVCLEENTTQQFQVTSCGVKTGLTKRCLNDKKCLMSSTGDAYCGTGNEVFCPAQDGVCACAAPTPAVLGCNSAGSADGPGETTLSLLDGCGRLQEEVAETCAVGNRCWYTWKADGGVDELAGAHCASSMDPSQRSSPFYRYACDFEMYMHATTSLEMDCRCNRSNAAMQECRPHLDAWTAGLRRGTGPNTRVINLAKWGGGFMLGGELFAPVHYTGGNAGNLKPGALWAFNITTENRRVVSGSYIDNAGIRVDVGGGYTVQGEALPFLTDAKLAADGMIYALGSNTLTHVEITRIDPANGNRTLVWRRQPLADAANAAYPYGQCFDGRVSSSYAGGYEPVQYADRSFGLGPNGTFFLGWNNDGVGVVRISADGSTCAHVSRWASNNTDAPLPNIGTGVTPQYGTISGMLYRNNVIYTFTENLILAINPATGNRSIFSSASNIGGLGETNFFVDEPRKLFFACGTDAARKCSVHHVDDGQNAQGLFQIGQQYSLLPGKYPQVQGAKGALDNANYHGNGAVALDPNDPNILHFVILSGMVKYEIDTGNSYIMSM